VRVINFRIIIIIITDRQINRQITLLSATIGRIYVRRAAMRANNMKYCYFAPDSGAEYCDERVCVSVCLLGYLNKNSSGDEIANVNFYAVRPGSYRNSLK